MSDKTHLTALGNYRFVIDKNTYNQLQRVISYRWEKTNIINNRPNYQLAGTDEEIITLTGTVYNYQSNQDPLDSPVTETGTDQITQMREQAQQGTPLRLALDDGLYMGYWIIKSIDETQSAYIGAAPVKQAYTVQLAYFGEKR